MIALIKIRMEEYRRNRRAQIRMGNYVDAVAEEGEIDLDVSHIIDAAFVRFCWADSPICNVYDSAGLPFELPITEAVRTRK